MPESVPSNRDAALTKKLAEFAKKVVLILHTCNNNEYLAVIKSLEPPTDASSCICYPKSSCVLGKFAGYRTAVVTTGQANECRHPLSEAVESFPNAQAIIGVGIAYANSKDLKYGDVMISKHIEDCVQVKFHDGKIINRGQRPRVRASVEEIFCRNVESWGLHKPFHCSRDRISSARSGCIVSAPWLVRDEGLKKTLFKHVPDALGGEMEGWALLEVQVTHTRVAVITIKGVADYGDKTKEDKWQFTAALAAVAYTHYQLERTGGSAFSGCE